MIAAGYRHIPRDQCILSDRAVGFSPPTPLRTCRGAVMTARQDKAMYKVGFVEGRFFDDERND